MNKPDNNWGSELTKGLLDDERDSPAPVSEVSDRVWARVQGTLGGPGNDGGEGAANGSPPAAVDTNGVTTTTALSGKLGLLGAGLLAALAISYLVSRPAVDSLENPAPMNTQAGMPTTGAHKDSTATNPSQAVQRTAQVTDQKAAQGTAPETHDVQGTEQDASQAAVPAQPGNVAATLTQKSPRPDNGRLKGVATPRTPTSTTLPSPVKPTASKGQTRQKMNLKSKGRTQPAQRRQNKRRPPLRPKKLSEVHANRQLKRAAAPKNRQPSLSADTKQGESGSADLPSAKDSSIAGMPAKAQPLPVPPTPVATEEQLEKKKMQPQPIDSGNPTPALDLAKERRMLQRARVKLRHGDAAEAAAILRTHQDLFRAGRLVEEREALWIDALIRLKRLTDAQKRARAFVQRYPNSLLRAFVESRLSSTP